MNLRDVVKFINEGYVMSEVEDVHVGTKDDPLIALHAASNGKNLAVTTRVSDNPYSTLTAYVREIIPVSSDEIALTIDNDSLGFSSSLLLRFRRCSQQERAVWRSAADYLDDLDGVHERDAREAAAALERTPQRPEKVFRYVAVVEANDEGTPIGVLVDQSPRTVIAVAIDNEDQPAMSRFAGVTALEQASEATGRALMLGSERSIRGADARDAAERACYKLAKDYYRSTGRSIYA